MTMSEEVWSLTIEKSGLNDRVLHESLHVSPFSARNKASRVLTYDVPRLDEWYERPESKDRNTSYTGYVLKRDEIDTWPIRIEADRVKIHNDE